MARAWLLWGCCALGLLAQERPSERLEAVFRLYGQQGPEAESLLLASLHDPAFTVRRAAASALGSQGSLRAEGIQGLIGVLADPCWTVRREAAQALSDAAAGDRDAAAALLQSALSDVCAAVRCDALNLLWNDFDIQDSCGEDGILPLLADPAFELRTTARWIVEEWDDPASPLTRAYVAFLGDADSELADGVAWELMHHDFEWRMLPRELVRFLRQTSDPVQRWRATQVLHARYPGLRLVCDLLLKMRDHPDPDVRLQVGRLLEELDSERARAAAQPLFDADPDVCLQKLQDVYWPSHDALRSCLRAADPALRLAALVSYDEMLGGSLPLDVVAELLDDADPGVRRATLMRFDDVIPDREQLQLLAGCLRDEDLEVARLAGELLVQQGPAALWRAELDRLAQREAADSAAGVDSASFQRRARALEELPPDAWQPLLVAADDPSHEVRSAAARNIGYLDAEALPGALPTLATLLRDPASETRAAALDAISMLEAAASSLLAAVVRCSREDGSAALRLLALQAAAEVDPEAALSMLSGACEDVAHHVRSEARFLLEELLLQLAAELPAQGSLPAAQGQALRQLRAQLGPEGQLALLGRFAEVGGPGFVALFADLLADPDTSLRGAALALAFDREDCTALLPSIRAQLVREKDPLHVEDIVELLAQEEHPCLPQVAQRLADPDPSVRAALLTLLAELGSAGQPLLRRCLRDPDPAVQELARAALAE